MSITQTEFDYLINLEKVFDDPLTPIQLGPAPIHWSRQLNSTTNKETFLFDFYRGNFELYKYTYNKRYRQTIILLRYDSGGRHTNPDGQAFEGPHVHLYREGYGDKFAFPHTEIGVTDGDSMEIVFHKIMYFCRVIRLPNVEVSMF